MILWKNIYAMYVRKNIKNQIIIQNISIKKKYIVYTNKLVKDNNENIINYSKPILKQVGGETQIIDKLIIHFLIEINNYHDIFLGIGSVLLTLLTYVKNNIIRIYENIYAYDINEPLIYIYKNSQSQHNELYDELQKIINIYNSCISKSDNIDVAKLSKENYYYWTRNEYNKLSINDKSLLGSAILIFINKTCFRGLFRMGPNRFNVP